MTRSPLPKYYKDLIMLLILLRFGKMLSVEFAIKCSKKFSHNLRIILVNVTQKMFNFELFFHLSQYLMNKKRSSGDHYPTWILQWLKVSVSLREQSGAGNNDSA
jgi:hypothetical protein